MRDTPTQAEKLGTLEFRLWNGRITFMTLTGEGAEPDPGREGLEEGPHAGDGHTRLHVQYGDACKRDKSCGSNSIFFVVPLPSLRKGMVKEMTSCLSSLMVMSAAPSSARPETMSPMIPLGGLAAP